MISIKIVAEIALYLAVLRMFELYNSGIPSLSDHLMIQGEIFRTPNGENLHAQTIILGLGKLSTFCVSIHLNTTITNDVRSVHVTVNNEKLMVSRT